MKSLKADITKRMFLLKDYYVRNNYVSEHEYWKLIGFLPTNKTNVQKGIQGFSVKHITSACVLTGADANWVLGIDKNMMRKPQKDIVSRLEEIVTEMKAQQKKK